MYDVKEEKEIKHAAKPKGGMDARHAGRGPMPNAPIKS